MTVSANAGVSVPAFQPDDTRHRRNIADWSQWVNQGHLQNTGMVTLALSAATTTVLMDTRISINSFVGFMPLTSNALSAGPSVWVSSQSAGGLTISHASSSSTDRNFRYCLLG